MWEVGKVRPSKMPERIANFVHIVSAKINRVRLRTKNQEYAIIDLLTLEIETTRGDWPMANLMWLGLGLVEFGILLTMTETYNTKAAHQNISSTGSISHRTKRICATIILIEPWVALRNTTIYIFWNREINVGDILCQTLIWKHTKIVEEKYAGKMLSHTSVGYK